MGVAGEAMSMRDTADKPRVAHRFEQVTGFAVKQVLPCAAKMPSERYSGMANKRGFSPDLSAEQFDSVIRRRRRASGLPLSNRSVP